MEVEVDGMALRAGVRQSLEHQGYAVLAGLASHVLGDLEQVWRRIGSRPEGFRSSARDSSVAKRTEVDRDLKRIMSPVIGTVLPGQRPFMAAYIDAPPGEHPVDFHQDLTYTDESRHRSYVLWVPLVDVDEDSGALNVIENSHLWGTGIRPGGRGGCCELAHLQSEFRALATTICATAGSVVIWDSALLHGASPNRSGRPRPVAAVTVASEQATLRYFHMSRSNVLTGFVIDDDYLAQRSPFTEAPVGYPQEAPKEPCAVAAPIEREVRRATTPDRQERLMDGSTSQALWDTDPDLEYLVADQFLGGFFETIALEAAMKGGLIDLALEEGDLVVSDFDDEIKLLIDVLRSTQVLVLTGEDRVAVSSKFRAALRHAELLGAKIHYAKRLTQDLARAPEAIFGLEYMPPDDLKYMHLFSYKDANSQEPDDVSTTEDWVRYMTVLTRSESPYLLKLVDINEARRAMDIGGNSGEFAFAMCASNPQLQAMVVDLPGVVAIGESWNAERDHLDRVTYVGADAFVDELPKGCDMVTFKGVLHDWGDENAATLIERAWHALEPGGRLVVLERSKVDMADHHPMPMSHITMLSWAWVLRGPQRYVDTLRSLGVSKDSVRIREVDLDLPWLILEARKER